MNSKEIINFILEKKFSDAKTSVLFVENNVTKTTRAKLIFTEFINANKAIKFKGLEAMCQEEIKMQSHISVYNL